MDANEIRDALNDLQGRLAALTEALDLDGLTERIGAIEARMAEGDFWDHPEAAQGVIEKMKKLKAVAEPLREAVDAASDLSELAELAEAEDDAATRDEIAAELPPLRRRVDRLENRALLSQPNDDKDAFVSVQAGAGGNDACECAELILRMYLRFFERRAWKAEELTWNPGEEAGLRSATYRVSGDHVYGYLRSEIGVHRIVRISPFSGKRETSFVGVDVMPEHEETTVEVDENDLRIDTYRSSGKGGQHVNKTDSAVRITHLPSGIVVAVQNERSQHKNKAMALRILRARLQRMEEAKREQALADLYGEKGEIAFGSQIRNYVFQPYTQVKDGRTGCEVGDIQRVLDGDLDPFVEAYLRWDVERRKKA